MIFEIICINIDNKSLICFNLSKGFLPLDECEKGNTSSIIISRLWTLTCEPLEEEILSKHLYLRRNNYDFLKGTLAQYECEAGYGFENISEVYNIFICNSVKC